MMKKIVSFIKNLSDNTKIFICRLWFAGMVCFFIAFGTSLGAEEETTSLVFTLGVVMGVGNLFIFNPIVFGMFEFERRGKIANKKMTERTILEGVLYMLSEILKSMFAVYIVSWCNAGINILVNFILNKDLSTISFPLEPISFAIMFAIIYYLLGKIWDLIVILYEKVFKKGQDKVTNEENI